MKLPFWSIVPLLLLAAAPGFSQSSIEGAWRPELYTLKDGTEKPVTGLIFFTSKDWTVLFFELDAEGSPQRGSGEGGTYTLSNEALEFTHFYHLSGGATPVNMSVKSLAEAGKEPCRVALSEDSMTIHFPSGNRMSFRRSSK